MKTPYTKNMQIMRYVLPLVPFLTMGAAEGDGDNSVALLISIVGAVAVIAFVIFRRRATGGGGRGGFGRDKTRDDLTQNLVSLGIPAEMAERKSIEERIGNRWHNRSLGVIDLPQGPVRWINTIKRDGGKNRPPKWWIIFCIPDAKPVSDKQRVKIKTVRKKSFPIFGKVINVVWTGTDSSTGLINMLSSDDSVKSLSKHIGNLEIETPQKEFQGWTLQVDRRFALLSDDWAAIEKIADYLLSVPRNL